MLKSIERFLFKYSIRILLIITLSLSISLFWFGKNEYYNNFVSLFICLHTTIVVLWNISTIKKPRVKWIFEPAMIDYLLCAFIFLVYGTYDWNLTAFACPFVTVLLLMTMES